MRPGGLAEYTREPTLDSYGDKIGTSFSAPIVSGVAALMSAVICLHFLPRYRSLKVARP